MADAPRDSAPWWRRVFHRYWWTLGWSSTYRPERKRPQLVWSLCLSNFNLPRLRWFREAGGWYLTFDYGNGNSDPAFSIGIERPYDDEKVRRG